MKSSLIFRRSFSALCALALAGCSRAQDPEPGGAEPPAAPPPPAPAPPLAEAGGVFRNTLTIDKTPMQRGGAVLKSYADMLEKVQPSVVTIMTGVRQMVRQYRMSQDEAQWRLYFGLPIPRSKMGPTKETWQQVGIGTGVIVTKNGYILTNRHVIIPPELQEENRDIGAFLDALQIRVNIPGRDGHVTADLVDYSAEMDVAVIKIEGADLPAAPLTDSNAARVGDVVFALGAPFGIEKTVTMGIISARRNDEVVPGFEKQDLLQTDASINPGNSGGPLIDADGRVIGINTAIYSRTGGNQGIGFAIPINNAVAAADALSSPRRGYLGVELESVPARYSRAYGFKGGAYISKEIHEGTPAAKAGLQFEDIILTFDGKPVEDKDDLRRRINAAAPGTKVKIEILRNERKGDLTVTVGERPNRFLTSPEGGRNLAAAPVPAEPKPDGEALHGMMLEPATLAEKASAGGEDAGALTALRITWVEPNSPAAACGLEKGDIILKINGRVPASRDDASGSFTTQTRNGMAVLHVRRGDTSRLVMMEVK